MANANSICSVSECGKSRHAGGLCSGHYHRSKRYGAPTAAPKFMNSGKCKVDGCESNARTKGWCVTHYWRWRHHGDPLGGRAARGEKGAWLEAHADHDGEGCLIFPFGTGRYGHVNMDGVNMHAHRAMCILAHGEPPTPEHEAAHSCGKGHLACVHPKHLRWDTPKTNQADRITHGTDSRGEKCATAILTEDQARFIKASRGKIGQQELAERFGVSRAAISAIHSGRNWGWLDLPLG